MELSVAKRPHGSASSFSHFDVDHWLKVRVERAKRLVGHGLQLPATLGHSLEGKRMLKKATGERYTVDQVTRDWHNGWYVRARLSRDGRHQVVLVENISCTDQGVLEEIARFHRDFEETS